MFHVHDSEQLDKLHDMTLLYHSEIAILGFGSSHLSEKLNLP